MSGADEHILMKNERSASSSSSSTTSVIKKVIVSDKAGGAASDSDDDLPLLEVYKKYKRKIAAETVKSSQNSNDGKKIKTEAPPVKTEAKPVKKEKESVSTKEERRERAEKPPREVMEPREATKSSSSNHNLLSSEFYDKTTKGFLVQTFLCRWWYAVDWPILSELMSAPAGYEALDGFPGVHIGTSQETLGQVLDLRDKSSMPSLKVGTANPDLCTNICLLPVINNVVSLYSGVCSKE